ncbi:MAG: pitrilysin family protein [Elusimicrobiota bacterium]|nr:pitrilysin family protein [Elusimicrobiota bacterium]
MKFFLIMLTALTVFGLNGFSPLKGFRKVALKNGLNIYIKEDHKLPIASIQLWVRAGSIDETEKNNGISHFLEHMLFKGTEKYSVGEISRIVESYGGIINAGTSKEFTCYYIDITSTGFIDALKIIAEIAACKATFPEEELERERLVILEEIKRSEDNPQNVLYENFNKQLFTVTPYSFRVIGSSEVVSTLTREDLMNYYKKFYLPNNMILVIVGDINYKKTVKILKELFGALKTDTVPLRRNLIEPVKEPSTEKVKKEVQQSYLICGFLGPELDREDEQCMGDVLSIILGSGRSSRLYRKLREEKQLVYSIGSGFYTQLGSGMFVVSAVCKPENVELVKREISIEFDRIINESVSKAELRKAKELLKSQMYFEYETYHQQAKTVGYWALSNKLKFVKNYIKKTDRVNAEDLRKFLKVYYTGLTTSILEPE